MADGCIGHATAPRRATVQLADSASRALERLKDVGGAPGSSPAYICIGRLYFENLAGFDQGLTKHGQEIMADIPNYTDAEVVLQVSETA